MAEAEAEAVPSRDDFNVAIICALELEAVAVRRLFDKTWKLGKAPGDHNTYTTGLISDTLTSLVWMSDYGKSKAASAAVHLRSSFRNIEYALVVGICGGVPTTTEGMEVVLGDVVISTVLQKYDEGKQYPEEYKATGIAKPHKKMRAFLRRLRGESQIELKKCCGRKLQRFFTSEPKYAYPGPIEDMLYRPDHIHKHYGEAHCCQCSETSSACDESREKDCAELRCGKDASMLVPRINLHNPEEPFVHFGIVGSGDTVMKSGKHRDAIAKRDKIVAFEMEGAGVCEEFDSIVVIKGVCDYADSHKNKKWQNRAAAVAAACTAAFLKELREEEWGSSPPTTRQSSYSSISTSSSATTPGYQMQSDMAFRPPLWQRTSYSPMTSLQRLQNLSECHKPRPISEYLSAAQATPVTPGESTKEDDADSHTPVHTTPVSTNDIPPLAVPAPEITPPVASVDETNSTQASPCIIQKSADEAFQTLSEAAGHKDFFNIAAALIRDPSVNVNAKTDKGKSMIHLVLGTVKVFTNKSKMTGIAHLIELLADHGADLSVTDEVGQCPLHYCVKTLNIEAMKVLLDRSADPNIADQRKRTPAYVLGFEKNAEPAMAEMLSKAGARLNGLKFSPLPGRPTESQRRVRAILQACH
ncbi:purine and uridine phosphorylase [Lophiostoma macrostomum CBS 122681]|uniref:Purine and uridine phosphorylase n=1 Tax=Lophiostoma macrostomum CBS 122681 TaxID=1314788 RepID=A0A6A6SUJ3_9PLEO|nr:purine and uridine phosphorylase [Lophiostoma macrostomum CBS 122681]